MNKLLTTHMNQPESFANVRRHSAGLYSSFGRSARRIAAVVGLVAAASFGGVVGAGQVAAQTVACSQSVTDTSGVIDVGDVVSAVAEIDSEVTVVVRGYDRVPNADLIAAVDELVLECFADEQDGIRGDVIVLAVSVEDRLSDVVIGRRWQPAIPDPVELRVDVMGPFFSEDDFTGGLVAGLEEIAITVDAQLAAEVESPSDGATATEDGTEDGTGGAAENDAGTDSDDGASETVQAAGEDDGRSPWAIGGGIAAVALGGGAFFLLNKQRRLSAARGELERAIASPLARQGTLRERDHRLVSQADIWTKTSAGRTKEALATAVSRLDETRNETDRARVVISRATPDGAQNASLAEIQRASANVLDLSRALDGHDEALDRLEALGAHLDHLRVAVPAKAQLLDEELEESDDLADQRDSEGWAVEGSRKELDGVADSIDALPLDELELDLLSLSDEVEALEAQLFRTNHYLQSLPSRLGSLKQWIEGLDNAAALEQRRIDELRREFSGLAAHHASDSWRWAADLPEQAMEHLNRSDAIQERVITELVSNQEFDEAGRELDRAGLEMIAADRLLDQVDDLIVDLERAMEEAPQIVAESREVLRSLAEFVEKNQMDLDAKILAAPSDLAAAIIGVEQELRQVKPNYLRVAETADRINRQIDEVLHGAREQHLRMESLRRELHRERVRASRALDRAKRSLGWEMFKSRDGQALDDLARDLGRLPDDLELAIEAAADVADDALRIQERIIARRRRSAAWVSTGGGGWTSGGGGWTSGGSSSSGGRTRSGGGRSFSRSSSRAGGGRSFGSGRSSGSF